MMRIVTESTKYPATNGYSVLLAEYFNSDRISVLTVPLYGKEINNKLLFISSDQHPIV